MLLMDNMNFKKLEPSVDEVRRAPVEKENVHTIIR